MTSASRPALVRSVDDLALLAAALRLVPRPYNTATAAPTIVGTFAAIDPRYRCRPDRLYPWPSWDDLVDAGALDHLSPGDLPGAIVTLVALARAWRQLCILHQSRVLAEFDSGLEETTNLH